MSRRFTFKRGDRVWFEYHCWESDESTDAGLWHRSHQRIKVLKLSFRGYGITPEERMENGASAGYRIRFADGFEGDAFEDELMKRRSDFERPDPPKERLRRYETKH